MNETDYSDIDLPPPTAPEAINFSMRAFPSTEAANLLANRIAMYLRSISRGIDLSRLDGVTVAYDYDAALAELDRGVAGLRTLSRSNDDQLIGVGMAPAVIRDGVVKVHLLFNAPYVEALAEEGGSDGMSEAFYDSLYLLAHECAHVQVTTENDQAFPNQILQHSIEAYEEAIFAQVYSACWEEYAACRLSAPFGEGRLPYYEEGLQGVLGVARERSAAAREAFWDHRNLNRAVGEVAPPLAEPIRIASYVLGHIDGRDDGVSISEKTRLALESAGYTQLFENLGSALRSLWNGRHSRTHTSEFDTVSDVARDAFWSGGLAIKPAEGADATIHVWEPEEVDPADLGLTKSWASSDNL